MKLSALSLIRDAGYEGGIQCLLDDISDGCGGCERASFGTPDGKVRWVSVLWENQPTVKYVSIVTDGYGENAPIVRIDTMDVTPRSTTSQDDHRRYAFVAEQFDKEEEG